MEFTNLSSDPRDAQDPRPRSLASNRNVDAGFLTPKPMQEHEVMLGGKRMTIKDEQGNLVTDPAQKVEAVKAYLAAQTQNGFGPNPGAEPGFIQRLADKAGDTIGDAGGYAIKGADLLGGGVARLFGAHPPALTLEQAQQVGRYVAPHDPTSLAMTAIGGPLTRLLGPAKAALFGGVGGALLEGSTGGNPLTGALQGVGGTAVPSMVASPTNKVVGAVQKLTSKGGVRLLDVDEAASRLRGLKLDSPALSKFVQQVPGDAAEKMASISNRPEMFAEALRRPIDRLEEKVASDVPQILHPNQPPAPAAAPAAQPVQPGLQALLSRMTPEQIARANELNPGMNFSAQAPAAAVATPNPLMIDTDKAFENWHVANDLANDYLKSNEFVKARVAAKRADVWLDAIRAQADPDTMAKWDAARHEFGLGKGYEKISAAGIRNQETAAGSPFNRTEANRVVTENPDEFSPARFPGLHQEVYPHGFGSQPEVTRPDVHARGFWQVVKANIPLPRSVLLPGQQPGMPPNLDSLLRYGVRTGMESSALQSLNPQGIDQRLPPNPLAGPAQSQ